MAEEPKVALHLPGTVCVADVMRTVVVSVAPRTALGEVVRIMLDEEIRFVPVVDGDALVGVITNSDLVDRGGLLLRLELQQALGRVPKVTARTAEDVMTAHPVTALPSQTIHEAAQLMLARHCKRLPVVDHGRLVGLVSRVDLLHIITGVHPTDANDRRHSEGRTAGDIADPEVPTVDADASIAAVLDAVVSTRLNRTVVVDSGRRVLGLITDAEMLRRLDRPERTLLDRLMRRSAAAPSTSGSAARELMVTPVATVAAGTPIGQAIRVMLAAEHKLLPVVDDDGRLRGMLDRADALRAVVAASRDDVG